MRRLALVTLLTLCPAVAQADGLPGSAFYPLGGCSMTGVCYSVGVGYFDPFGYVTNISCTNTTECSYIVAAHTLLYDERGNLVLRYASGGIATQLQSSNVPVWGVLEITPVVNGNPTGFERVFLTTPEPGTMALLGTGLLALAGAARRRRLHRLEAP